MTKQEYMDKLREKLAGFDKDIRDEIISDYEEHFRMGELNRKTEEQICEELGSIDELVDELTKLTDSDEGSREAGFDSEQFKQAADNFSKSLSDAMRGIAGFMGNFAANVTKGTSKFVENFSESAEPAINRFTDKAEEYAKAFAEGFEEIADKVVDKSEAFAKEVSESYQRNVNRDAADAAAKEDAAPDGTGEDPCSPFFKGPKIEFSASDGQDEDEDEDDFEDEDELEDEDEDGVVKDFSCENVDTIVIQTDSGDVVAEASDDNVVYVEYENDGTPNQQLAYGFNFRQDGSTAYAVAKKLPGTSNFFKSISSPDITVTVRIPVGMKNVSIRTLSGDVDASDLNVSLLTINTMSGDVDLDNCLAKESEISTMSGDVDFRNCSLASGRCNTVSGDISADDSVLQDFAAKTTSGDIDLNGVKAQVMSAATISGDIYTELTGADGYQAHVKTTCGEVSLGFNDETIEIIRSGNYVMGSGAVKLELESVSGDITVEAAK